MKGRGKMERPILFSTEMVRAILDGRKTITRRVIKPQPPLSRFGISSWEVSVFDADKRHICPYGKPGTILWVRETWCKHTDIHDNSFEEPLIAGYYYKADAPKYWVDDREIVKWRPSIHMPKEAARLFLKVTNVRVERLQDITQEDIISEGLWSYSQEFREEICKWRDCASAIQETRVKYFKNLWDSIYAKRGYGWDTNPWLWVVEFERTKAVKA